LSQATTGKKEETLQEQEITRDQWFINPIDTSGQVPDMLFAFFID